MVIKAVTSFVLNYLPNLKESQLETKEIVNHLIQRLKLNPRLNHLEMYIATVDGRKALNTLLSTEISFLKGNDQESCLIIVRVFRERYSLKDESDEDLVSLLKYEDPTLGFDFFMKDSVVQKKLFRNAFKNVSSPRIKIEKRNIPLHQLSLDITAFNNSDEEQTIKRVLLGVFKGKEGLGFDALCLVFIHFFTIKNLKELEGMDEDSLRRIATPNLPHSFLQRCFIMCFLKFFGKPKPHLLAIFPKCVDAYIQGIKVDELFDEEKVQALLGKIKHKLISDSKEQECIDFPKPEAEVVDCDEEPKKMENDAVPESLLQNPMAKQFEELKQQMQNQMAKQFEELKQQAAQSDLFLNWKIKVEKDRLEKEITLNRRMNEQNDNLTKALAEQKQELQKALANHDKKLEAQKKDFAAQKKDFERKLEEQKKDFERKFEEQKTDYERKLEEQKIDYEKQKNELQQEMDDMKKILEKQYQSETELLKNEILTLNATICNFEHEFLVLQSKRCKCSCLSCRSCQKPVF